MLTKIKGTQDFLDLRLFNYIIKAVREHVTLYHFNEIATPILEPIDLFKRSLGLQTDVVAKEMFLIAPRDEKEQERICLRPEATAPTVRAFIEHHIQLTPWKVFSWGPMFRYERPQKGRYRQFHQINIETIGSQSIAQDAQFIKMLDRFFHEKLQLNNYLIDINFIGCFEDRAMYRQLLLDFLDGASSETMCSQCDLRKSTNIMRVFDCKSAVCQKVLARAPFIADNLCTSCDAQWQQLREQLELLSVSFNYRPTLVRGLDYYNKTVFEFSSGHLGAQNAFCGGGRYDQLVGQLGGKQDQPSLGAAIGMERLMLLLHEYQDQLPLEQLPVLHLILPLSQAQQPLALLLADELQAHGLCTDILLEGDSIKSMMRKAHKMGARSCLLLGDEEQKTKTVMLKHMITGQQERVAQADVLKLLLG